MDSVTCLIGKRLLLIVGCLEIGLQLGDFVKHELERSLKSSKLVRCKHTNIHTYHEHTYIAQERITSQHASVTHKIINVTTYIHTVKATYMYGVKEQSGKPVSRPGQKLLHAITCIHSVKDTYLCTCMVRNSCLAYLVLGQVRNNACHNTHTQHQRYIYIYL